MANCKHGLPGNCEACAEPFRAEIGGFFSKSKPWSCGTCGATADDPLAQLHAYGCPLEPMPAIETKEGQ